MILVKAVKKFLRYLQGYKDLMLTYRRIDTLKVVGFSDSDYAGDSLRSYHAPQGRDLVLGIKNIYKPKPLTAVA